MAAKRISAEKMERLWLIEDVHEYTQIPMSTLRLYTATSEIPSIKIGRHRRYDPIEIRKWIERKRK